ncbi:hypothetical protein [Roseovarius aestuariivivens]|uniref:hypothetical protein n=1 Tax=Roseovarius aestuariivivens TaxID=1888910 RepID=UPI001081124A|nr:hypothetical protein [Roseovarius aestuariivivens]
MSRFGPSRGELWFRCAAGLLGLAGLAGLCLWRGLPSGAAFFELIVIGGGFFGGTAVWAGWKLFKRDHP